MTSKQYKQVNESDVVGIFPTTRYQGSKKKIINWIEQCVSGLEFETVFDAFGGTGSVSYMFKLQGKQVFYNDYLRFNTIIGQALIENSNVLLNDNDLNFLFAKHPSVKYPTFIFDNFKEIYFTDEENQWLDLIITNIYNLENEYKKALAFFALFQACLIKRPYSLFHRKNLYVRTANVKRSFGNKKTWDTSFEKHFLKFVKQGNEAVFDNGKQNLSLNCNVVNNEFNNIDLVYIDSPYISKNGTGTNYLDFYHFLEGIVNYENWNKLIDIETKHKKIKNEKNEWAQKKKIHTAFEKLFVKFKDSKIVVSYRDDGIPTIEELANMLKKQERR